MSGWGGWGGPPPPPNYTSPPHYTPSPPPLAARRAPGQPFIPCPRPMWPNRPGFASPTPRFYCPSPLPRFSSSPRPYSPVMCPSPEYFYAPPAPFTPESFTGVPLEPPGPLEGYLGGDYLEAPGPSDGRATADIIAAQSQDYVDEKLAEYQATIYHLQGKLH